MVTTQRFSASFWFVFAFASVLIAGLSYKYFDKVTPIVQLSISADRQQVLDDGMRVATELQWDVVGYQTSVEFDSDGNLQSFVELEGGGKKAFVDMFQSGAYYPYQWVVRFFKEQEVVEMRVSFTPDGKRIGFAKKLSEKSCGQALSKEDAQAIVEKSIATWCPHFENYKSVEYDSEKQDSGRIDHTFVYERTDLVIGKGLYRFKAKVCGDQLAKLEPFVKIPDEFTRRYQEMRSANTLLAFAGSFLFRMLYLFIFGLFGLLYFYRRNYLLVKPAFYVALFVASLEFFSGFNDYRLWWTSYNTVQSSSTFIMQKCFGIFIEFFALLAFIFVGLLVAEAAGRAMYKHQVQFFKLFSWPALSSDELFKQVSLAYLCTPFMFGYEIIYMYVTETYWSWWSPSYSFADPNILASYLPWFSPISISLRAGFAEEVLFRALPLAMIAVLTQKSKHKKLWFVCMFVLQAAIFGACHASYPNQPFFARLVELIIPSFGFGALYCTFGLVPGALGHFLYDAILFALPVFASNLFWSKIMVVLLMGLPFLTVLSIFIYNRKLYVLPVQYFNHAFHATEYVAAPFESRRIGDTIPQRNVLIAFMLGVLGLGLWLMTHHFCPDMGPLYVEKSQAIKVAADAVQQKFGIDVTKDWEPVCTVLDNSGSRESRFALQVYGKDAYQKMQGTYIQGACWLVRFVQFHRPVQDRGEEYKVTVSNCCRVGAVLPKDMQPKILSMNHVVPEHYCGADISQEQALLIAHAFIEKQFGLAEQDTELISVADNKVENRRNWSIIIGDTKFFDFDKEGQARIHLTISGDVVTEYSRFVFVPEDWSRADASSSMNVGTFKMILYFLMILFIMLGFMLGAQKLLVSQYGTRMMQHKGLFVGALVVILSVNNFCLHVGTFNSAEPYYDQFLRKILQITLLNTCQIFFCSIFLAVGAVGFIKGHKPRYMRSLLLALVSGLFITGVVACISQYDLVLQPRSGNFIIAGSSFPAISLCGLLIKTFCLVLSVIIALFLALKALSKQWPNQVWMQVVCAILFCLSLEAMGTSESILFMIAKGFIVGIIVYGLYRLILRYDMTLLPLILAVLLAFDVAPELLYPSYIGACLHAACAITMMIAVGLFFYERAHIE